MFIAFGTPFGGSASPAHYRHRAIVQASRLSDTFVSIEIDLAIVSKARNEIVEALPPNVDALWFVDSDILLPNNAGQLLDYLSDETPVVSGLYFSRKPPHLPQVYFHATSDPYSFSYLPVIQIPPRPFFADATGAGCLIVRTDVLRELADRHQEAAAKAKEWLNSCEAFKSEALGPTEEAAKHFLQMGLRLGAHFEFLQGVGEDFYFCNQLYRYLGIRPLVVPEVECGHEATVSITRAHFQASMGQGPVQYSAKLVSEQMGDLPRKGEVI